MRPTYSFDDTLPTSKDYVRSRIGDKDGDPQWFLTDAEINALLRICGSVDEACAQAAENLGAIYIKLADEIQQRSVKLVYRGRATQAYALADRIRNLAQPDASTPNPGASGGTISGPCFDDFDCRLPEA